MSYGQEKSREMARSLLPSKNRESARHERAHIHRTARRRNREELARLARDPESFEDVAGLDADANERIRVMVWRRRSGDKIAPFIRWAKAITRPLPQRSRMSHIRSLVPRGVIGEHALQHLEDVKGFGHPNETALRDARQRAWVSARRPSRMDRGEQAELLRALLQAPGGQRAFNRWLQAHHVIEYRQEKRRRPCPCEPGCTVMETVNVPVGNTRARVLLGLHDVLPFLTEQHQAMNAFLRAFKAHHGDVSATVRELRLESKVSKPLRRPAY
ncbi:hypothetical protein [Archangium sp.]|uniref:hypothetical protein n=1 Tax=Archangium sp. TaxID=1872627 RepID=UPI002D6F89EE|nr:hypothetical protein [Archangium sp.]HYO59042.1 hypothetical protein [Archangium sp.]